MRDAWHAIDTMRQGWRTDYTSSYATILCRGVRHGSAKTYAQELVAAIRGLPDDMPLEQALQRQLEQLALRQRGGWAAHNVVPGVGYCEKVGLLRQTISETHWMAVKAIDRTTPPNAPPRVWTTARNLETLGSAWGHGAWEQLLFAGLLAAIYCLRVGDLESLCWGWLGTPGWFTFHAEKVNGQATSYPLSDYMEQWHRHLYAQRRPDHRDFTRPIPSGRDTIRTLLRTHQYPSGGAHVAPIEAMRGGRLHQNGRIHTRLGRMGMLAFTEAGQTLRGSAAGLGLATAAAPPHSEQTRRVPGIHRAPHPGPRLMAPRRLQAQPQTIQSASRTPCLPSPPSTPTGTGVVRQRPTERRRRRSSGANGRGRQQRGRLTSGTQPARTDPANLPSNHGRYNALWQSPPPPRSWALWSSLGMVPMDSDELTGEASGEPAPSGMGPYSSSNTESEEMRPGHTHQGVLSSALSAADTLSFSTDVSDTRRQRKKRRLRKRGNPGQGR